MVKGMEWGILLEFCLAEIVFANIEDDVNVYIYIYWFLRAFLILE